MEWVGAWGDPQYPASGRLCVRESHWASLEDPLINQRAESNHFQHPIIESTLNRCNHMNCIYLILLEINVI